MTFPQNMIVTCLGHTGRRTSATLLATASEVNTLDLKRHDGWKSIAIAESYIADNVKYKQQTKSSKSSTINCHLSFSQCKSSNRRDTTGTQILHIRPEIQMFDSLSSHRPIPEDGFFVHKSDKNFFKFSWLFYSRYTVNSKS